MLDDTQCTAHQDPGGGPYERWPVVREHWFSFLLPTVGIRHNRNPTITQQTIIQVHSCVEYLVLVVYPPTQPLTVYQHTAIILVALYCTW